SGNKSASSARKPWPAAGGRYVPDPAWLGTRSSDADTVGSYHQPAMHMYRSGPARIERPRPGPGSHRSPRHIGEHACLVGAPLLACDHAKPVGRVDHGNQDDQRDGLVVVVMLTHLGPGLVRYAEARVGEAGALLRERQGGPLGLGEHAGLAPGGD